MLNTKLNLYNAEWLDVVFDDRNKAYGAYDLRVNYGRTMIKAMAIAFSVIVAGSAYIKLTAKEIEPVEITKKIEVVLPPPKMDEIVEAKPEKPEPAKPAKPEAPAPAASQIKFTTPVVTDKPVVDELPTIAQLAENTVGTTTTPGNKTGDNATPTENTTPGGGGSGTAEISNEVQEFAEVNPEPFGGMEAFGKFLGKTLRYPARASEAGVQGRVIMSFVVERDGTLSNITVVRGIGYGLDEEASRVLKLAKAWKPGMQNGHAVRVRYTIPINFQLPE
ncbi:energy transducer TonB [Mucilaginibacter pallidiroseus]|uniref:Energy transducer TonB n=1 Tax=Mucilaginibacter pallidiroseus TaxID=2599295 RepID=A0A563UIB2_9SPHI|nr:energy transducer TonB [Mucilaginibacter pallidiroseus]TWR31033.1 energy transducer TonB [Mucilaginibacter pallidiroseus]